MIPCASYKIFVRHGDLHSRSANACLGPWCLRNVELEASYLALELLRVSIRGQLCSRRELCELISLVGIGWWSPFVGQDEDIFALGFDGLVEFVLAVDLLVRHGDV